MATEATMQYDYNLNASLAVGDLLYCTCVALVDNTWVNTNPPVLFGELTEINTDTIGFSYTQYPAGTPNTIPCAGGTKFISFSKNKAINESSLKGYYNLVTFLNDDNSHEAELFVVNSETGFSSK